MTGELEIRRLAIHHVDKGADSPEYAPHEQNISSLHPRIIEFILDLIYKIRDAEDTGTTRSAHFRSDEGELGPSIVKQIIENVHTPVDKFFDASKELASHLYEQSPATASAGLLATVELHQLEDGTSFTAILKIRYKNESIIKIVKEALTNLEVEHVENILMESIQKGAIIPHPDRNTYDLKIVDQQARDDPAQYFSADFLGCLTKKSDEHQVKKLVPEIERYARKAELPIAVDKVPQVIASLQERDSDVTTALVAEVIQEQELLGSGFQPDDFTNYIEQESSLGHIDIPKSRFASRGRTAKSLRNVKYDFHDPELRGVSLSGPPHVIAKILSVDGDTYTFRIQTTKDGFNLGYG